MSKISVRFQYPVVRLNKRGKVELKKTLLDEAYVYIFNREYVLCWDKTGEPAKVVKAWCNFKLEHKKTYYCHFSGRKLNADEIASLAGKENRHKLITIASARVINYIPQSYFVFKVLVEQLEAKNVTELISKATTLFNKKLTKRKPFYSIITYEGMVLPGNETTAKTADRKNKVITVGSFIEGLNSQAVSATESFVDLLKRVVEKAVVYDEKSSLRRSWDRAVINYADPFKAFAAMHAHCLVSSEKITANTTLSNFFAGLDSYFYAADRDEVFDASFRAAMNEEIDKVTYTETNKQIFTKLTRLYFHNILTILPVIKCYIPFYYDIYLNVKLKKSYKIQSIIENTQDLKKFSVHLYGADEKFIETKNFTLDLSGADPGTHAGVQSHVDKVFDLLVQVTDASGIPAKQAFRYVIEKTREFYRDMGFDDGLHQAYAYAAISRNLADKFAFNNSVTGRRIKYERRGEQLIDERTGRLAKVRRGKDCVSFSLIGAYVLGYIDKNIFWAREAGSGCTLDDIDLQITDYLDGENIPFKGKFKEKRVYKVLRNGQYLFNVYETDGSDFLSFLISREREQGDYTGKTDRYVIEQLVKSKTVKGPYVTHEFSQYYSNGVRNVLANCYGLFDFYTASEVKEKDRTGMMGVMRKDKEDRPVNGFFKERSGWYKITNYTGDYVSHFYVVLSDNAYRAHSTSYVNRKKRINVFGFTKDQVYPKHMNKTYYYLRLKLNNDR